MVLLVVALTARCPFVPASCVIVCSLYFSSAPDVNSFWPWTFTDLSQWHLKCRWKKTQWSSAWELYISFYFQGFGCPHCPNDELDIVDLNISCNKMDRKIEKLPIEYISHLAGVQHQLRMRTTNPTLLIRVLVETPSLDPMKKWVGFGMRTCLRDNRPQTCVEPVPSTEKETLVGKWTKKETLVEKWTNLLNMDYGCPL